MRTFAGGLAIGSRLDCSVVNLFECESVRIKSGLKFVEFWFCWVVRCCCVFGLVFCVVLIFVLRFVLGFVPIFELRFVLRFSGFSGFVLWCFVLGFLCIFALGFGVFMFWSIFLVKLVDVFFIERFFKFLTVFYSVFFIKSSGVLFRVVLRVLVARFKLLRIVPLVAF